MSSVYYYDRPSTPPAMFAAGQFAGNFHTRHDSSSSNNSSPDSGVTNITTPNRSPIIRQHGPALLPKIRPQDLVVEPVSSSGPYRHRKVLSNTRNPPGFAPYSVSRSQAQRALTSPIDCSLISPISTCSVTGTRGASTLSSPVTLTPSHTRKGSNGHSRSGSAGSVDEATLRRYLYPTSRQIPKYVSQYSPTTPVSASDFLCPTYPHLNDPIIPRPEPSPLPHPTYSYAEPPITTLAPAPAALSYAGPVDLEASTTLLRYLTEPTQAINLVRNVTYPLGRGQQLHFWWDIRNLRNWSSFCLSTVDSIPGLTQLLTTQVAPECHPLSAVSQSRLSPSSEASLSELIRDIYAPRVNAALETSLGKDARLCLKMTPEAHVSGNRGNSGPHFIASYHSDRECTASGSQRGRVVGLIKSFDTWNSGMRNEQPHKRVEYLNGLAHLQRCMRDHSCRYGFIMTEIELVCVRAGCDQGDDVPYFGYLEVAAPIATNLSSETYYPSPTGMARSQSVESNQSSDYSSSSRGTSPAKQSSPAPGLSAPFTATMALYYLVMLSKAVPLPSQPSWHLNVGGPGALTRQRILPEGKDKWIPEPQTGEKRDAKRVRGWVWPQDPWNRREGGQTKAKARTTAKKWHK
ncbi:hypothetical protein FQN52_009026 [Onygenales sp. PD_12]|nr:hypothetical protein FQN53_005717 [Emmonsiellopsis sp. PD_33]KAK2784445.1 hypothetical protein FQN52_009026 [Onygenales sp. PD_12]